MTDANDETKTSSTDELHQLVMQQFEEYADGTIDSRTLAEKCRDYRDGKQWTEAEQEVLRKRKQPCITDNKIQDKCDTLLGIEKQMRTDPKAYPRNPTTTDEKSAEAATDALRFVADQNVYKQTCRKNAADNLMVEGLCAGQVIIEKRKGQPPKVCMEHIRWDRVYYDIRSLSDDFSDKTYCGYFTWMDFEQAKEDWPNAVDALEQSFTGESATGPDKSLDDKPRFVMTVRERKRVQVFTHYFKRRGKWWYGRFCKGGWLEKPKASTYKDEYGEPDCCIELQALYRDAEGNPYGSVQRYLDLQDEHNKRRSKMLHLLNAKRIIAPKGAFEGEGGIAKARAELHKPDGVVEHTPGMEVKIEDNLAEADAQFLLMQQTDLALSQTGPNSALAGTSGNISGIAKARDQQAGQLPISPLFEALDTWEMRMYRQVWCRIRQYWTAEMWVRITDDEDKLKFVPLNQPILVGDKLAEQAAQNPEFQQMPPEEQRAIIQEIAARPEAQQPMLGDDGRPMKRNDVAVIDVDIIIDRGQDTVTVQQEEFSQLAEIAKGRPEIPFDVLVEMSQLRSTTKKKVVDRLKGDNDPAAQMQAQWQQMMQQLQGMLMEAQVRRENAAAAKDEAATVESQVDASVKVAEFTTKVPGAEGTGSKTQVSVN